MKKFLIPAAVAAVMTGTAYAQAEFYVVQDTSTKKCTIVDKKPTTTAMSLLAARCSRRALPLKRDEDHEGPRAPGAAVA